jgi:hypothetical protein
MTNKTDIFVENIYRLKFKLINVGQTEKVERATGSGGKITLSVKYLPQSEDIYANLDEVAAAIKKLPGVRNIKILTYNKRPVLKNGKPIIY